MIELMALHPRFKLSAEQQTAWFRRLEHFSDDAMTRAVEELASKDDAMTFPRLRSVLGAHRGRQPVRWEQIEIQGLAPISPESRELGRIAFKRLSEAHRDKKKDPLANPLTKIKSRWVERFKALPGYVKADTVTRLVESQDEHALSLLGVPQLLTRQACYHRADDIRQDARGRNWVTPPRLEATKPEQPLRDSDVVEYRAGHLVEAYDPGWFE